MERTAAHSPALPASQYGTPARDFLPDRDFGTRRRRQIDVDPRAEADETVALAAHQLVAGAYVALDAPRDLAGNLHRGVGASCWLVPVRVVFGFGGRLVVVGGVVGDGDV